jgi:putative peptidoglycan lipid II flippase
LYDYAHGIYAIAAGITVYGIGNFTFPRLSRFFAQGEQEEAERELARALCAVFAVTLPVAASVAVLSRDAVLLLYGRGSFGAELIPVCASALGILSSAMPAGAAAEIFSRAFYASGKNGAPAKAACTAISVCIAANALSLFFGAGLFGICAAFSAAVWAHALSLLRFAVREFQEALRAARKIALLAPAFLLCTAIMAFLAKKTEFFSSFPETIATFLKIAIVFTVGNVIYLICIYIMGFLRPEKRKEVE